MNNPAAVIEFLLSSAESALDRAEKGGADTTLLRVKVALLRSNLAQSKGLERAGLWEESKGEDRYSARVAASHLRASADLTHDAARILESAARDPHQEVLTDAGIRDA